MIRLNLVKISLSYVGCEYTRYSDKAYDKSDVLTLNNHSEEI